MLGLKNIAATKEGSKMKVAIIMPLAEQQVAVKKGSGT